MQEGTFGSSRHDLFRSTTPYQRCDCSWIPSSKAKVTKPFDCHAERMKPSPPEMVAPTERSTFNLNLFCQRFWGFTTRCDNVMILFGTRPQRLLVWRRIRFIVHLPLYLISCSPLKLDTELVVDSLLDAEHLNKFSMQTYRQD